ncbi:hypothetical protein N0V88_006298 [Collariella sp. IMI 366227]|nr:hypothetical protein N0V88_006298 [Collariella sp. IMI 366227]
MAPALLPQTPPPPGPPLGFGSGSGCVQEPATNTHVESETDRQARLMQYAGNSTLGFHEIYFDIDIWDIISNMNKYSPEFQRKMNLTPVHDPSFDSKRNKHTTARSTSINITHNPDDLWLSEHWDLFSSGHCFESLENNAGVQSAWIQEMALDVARREIRRDVKLEQSQ